MFPEGTSGVRCEILSQDELCLVGTGETRIRGKLFARSGRIYPTILHVTPAAVPLCSAILPHSFFVAVQFPPLCVHPAFLSLSLSLSLSVSLFLSLFLYSFLTPHCSPLGKPPHLLFTHVCSSLRAGLQFSYDAPFRRVAEKERKKEREKEWGRNKRGR